jgi:transcriptional regulator
MYNPSHFVESNPQTLREFIARHSFATLVSHRDDGPIASHLPLLFDAQGGPHGRLLGHMARANDQWRSASGQRVLAIFHGPHAYISPTWYAAEDVVPTWNYVVVHVTGTLRLVDDRERLLEIICRTVETYESPQPKPWSLDAQDAAFIDKLLGAVVGFEIDIEQIEGKWKLNQNHPAERREKVIRALRATGGHDALEIAELMAGKLT